MDPFINLSLDMTDSSTLGGCLERYCRVEKLPGRDYNCTGCGPAQMATKQLTIHRSPPCLVLHVKRFEQAMQTTSPASSKSAGMSAQQQPLQKIDKHLHFGTELPLSTLRHLLGGRVCIGWWGW